MTNEQLLEQCKIGLDMDVAGTDFDDVLLQKISMVKGYMSRAGVADENMDAGVIVLGVSDSWNTKPGDAKFSKLFIDSVVQLRGEADEE